MVSKLDIKVRRIGAAFMAVLGFFIVFFFSNPTSDSNGVTFGTIAHADVPPDPSNPTDPSSCSSGPGCCGSCGDGSAADCGSSGGSGAGSCD